jgi:hypothetical protein
MVKDCTLPLMALGHSLFLGAETAQWSLVQFSQVAQFADQHGFESVLVKVFDGANGGVSGGPDEWYGPIGGFAAVKLTMEKQGVSVIPYGYLYGNSQGSKLDLELALVYKYLNAYSLFCVDIEEAWAGQTSWATQFNQTLVTNGGYLYASTLANPQDHNLLEVYQIIAPSITVWLPQVYTSYLNGVYVDQYAGFECVIPTADLSTEFGPNDPAQVVQDPVVLWEYQTAIQNTALVASLLGRTPMVQVTSKGEIADFCDADQFQPAKTQDACGFFSVAIVDAAAPVGKPCTKTVSQVITEAEAWYAQYDGSNAISNTAGMTLDQEYRLLAQVNLKYYPLGLNLNQIRGWLKAGYPVIICAPEFSFYDLGLNDTVPYYWTPVGNHIVVLTGVTSDGNFLVRDPANVTDLYNPNSLRPGPRKYDASKLQLLWATAIIMHGQAMPLVQGGIPVGTPTGWKDDGKTLTPPNNIPVVDGFRTYILNHTWNAANVPQEKTHAENPVLLHVPSLGSGTVQLFRDSMLWWTPAKGVVNEPELGIEIYLRDQQINKLNSQLAAATAQENTDTAKVSSLTTANTNLQQQVETLQAQLASGTTSTGSGISPDEQTAIDNAVAALTVLQQFSSQK